MNLKKIISIALFFTLTLTRTLYAVTNQNSELTTLNKSIASIQTQLHQATLKKSQLQNALTQTEINENHLHHQLKKTKKILSKQQTKLQQLQQQSIPLANAKNQNHILLKQQIRAAYLFSHQSDLKILLSPRNSAQKHRTLMYFHYITKAQIKTINQLQQSLIACQKNQRAILQQHVKLLALKQTQLQNQQALQKTKIQRQELIQAINDHIQTKHQKLMSLLHNKQQLERTIALLNAQTQKKIFHHASNISNQPFGQLRGKLSWPTQGAIRHAFGTQVYQSELRWDGVLISALAGQSVHAVASGRVIFSRWMAGYGLLLIVNQGNGYMTLYGRNQTLTKKVGDWVSSNEVIGTVGKSGGFTRPGLYFSIRFNGKAVNPAMWCR